MKYDGTTSSIPVWELVFSPLAQCFETWEFINNVLHNLRTNIDGVSVTLTTDVGLHCHISHRPLKDDVLAWDFNKVSLDNWFHNNDENYSGRRKVLDLYASDTVDLKVIKYIMVGMKKEERVDQIALFNLYSIKAEVDRVKQSIREGRLWEYTMKKARAHPKLFETIDAILDNTKFLQDGTPKFKEKAIFLYGPEDQYRPEAMRYREYVKKFRTKKDVLVITRDPNVKPVFTSYENRKLSRKLDNND